MLNDHLHYNTGKVRTKRSEEGDQRLCLVMPVLAGKRWSYWSYAVVGFPVGG